MIAQAILRPELLRDSHLEEPSRTGNPWCTRAQMIRYLGQDGRWLVEVFQYRRPDGSLGASGKPDPKRLRVEDAILVAESPAANGEGKHLPP